MDSEQKRAAKRAARARRKKSKSLPERAKIKVINERKTVIVPREGEKRLTRFWSTWRDD